MLGWYMKGHATAMKNLMEDQQILHGGTYSIENRYVAPTLIKVDDLKNKLMQDEILVLSYRYLFMKMKQKLIKPSIITKNPYLFMFFRSAKNGQRNYCNVTVLVVE